MESQLKKKGSKVTTIKDFESLKVLGTGTYGKVMLVRHKSSRKLYAMKVLKIKTIKEKNQVEHTKTERRVLEKLKHPFIVRMKYAFKDREKLYFVLDYCQGGELFFYLTNLRRFKEDAAKFYSANILLALKALHEQDIIYRE
jgi:protein-serine/threonine kinase